MALTKISTGMLKQDAASSDLNIDAGTLYLDVSNNRVGIATTSPGTPLDVQSNSSAEGIRVRGRSSDNAYVTKKIGWKVKTSLKDGLTKTYHWINQQINSGTNIDKFSKSNIEK